MNGICLCALVDGGVVTGRSLQKAGVGSHEAVTTIIRFKMPPHEVLFLLKLHFLIE